MADWDSKSFRPSRRRRSSGSTRELLVKQAKPSPQLQALILDNGAYTIKVGYSKDEEPRLIPNCIMKAKSERKRLFVGKQIEECRDCSGLYFLLPCERGYITRWEVQKPVWDHVFSKNVCPIEDNPVILTQPLFNFKSIQDCIDEIFFEEYEVTNLFRCVPTDLAYLNYIRERNFNKRHACVIVDSGYSFTHIIPYINGSKFVRAIRRLNVGGKLLTNHLKDIISYRQYNVMEETYVINQVKEDTCYVSEDVKKELLEAAKPLSRNSIVRNYVLPDFNGIRRGFILDPNKTESEDSYQILRLNNERFIVPEILFHPSDIGMKSMGIAEAVVKSIMSCPIEQRESLSKSIILIGGNCKFPGFKERMYAELRSLLPDKWHVNVFQPDDAATYSWKGGNALLKSQDFRNNVVTKKDYDELGSMIIQERFNNFMFDYRELQTQSKPDRDQEKFKYLSKLKSGSIFGKSDVAISIENTKDQIKVDAEGENSNSGQSEKDELSVEDTGQDVGIVKRSVGRPGKTKEVVEVVQKDIKVPEEEEENLCESIDLFPFGTNSYL
ncbi:hypothetical protein ABEB36_001266 [Hypothenemus hampei]|uniref:Actin-related protein 6 n=1 Tax=Hypothenemus hampei TaxID=57062 RepID=A0ABD1FH92_HYPHA